MRPTVSIIVPCYNEEATIGSLLKAILDQTYPKSKMEVIIADGQSTDGTRAVIGEFQRALPSLEIRVVENPSRTIPAGLNSAIRNSGGEIVVRLDAHSVPIPEYVARCVEDLQEGRGINVGGTWVIRPGATTRIARAIAAAAAHPLGAGDALYRLGGAARSVDTVPFGAFRRSLIDTVGGFDEGLLTNEDYEFNVRLRKTGGVIWLDPQIQSTYFARSTLADLARQYWRYGFWKLRVLSRYPETLRWRQALPAAFALALVVLPPAAAFWAIGRLLLALMLAIYILALSVAAVQIAARGREPGLVPASMLAFATMHVAWGLGFWWSLLKAGFSRNG